MPVGVIARDSLAKPDHRLHSKVVGKHLLIGHAVHRWISFLDLRKQALFRRQQRSGAVDINRSTFEHNAMVSREGLHHACARGLRHAGAHLRIELVIRILGPRVEFEIQSEHVRLIMTRVILQKNAAGVARPHAIGTPEMETHFVGKRMGFLQYHSRPLLRIGTVYDQVNAFVAREVADNLRIYPLDRLELARPVIAKMRPGEPRGFMRLPLGGHAIARFSGKNRLA